MDATASNALRDESNRTSRFDMIDFKPRTKLMIITAAAVAPWCAIFAACSFFS